MCDSIHETSRIRDLTSIEYSGVIALEMLKDAGF